MKQCPKCSRTYSDETLNFCLEDGAWLVADDEPTAILRTTDPLGDAPTCAQIGTTAAEPEGALEHARPKGARDKVDKRLVLAGMLVILALGGFAGYRYFSWGGSGQIDSIAVMPFANESGNSEIDYLSDGMTETLINTLTQLPNLKVKPRSSSFRYRGRESDAKVIGDELSVGAILNGRLVQRGDEITLFLSLIDTGSETQIWGKQYSRRLANLITLQSEVARDVSENLRTRLTGADNQLLAKNDTTNPEAYRLYLQGRFFWNKRRIGDMGKAIGFFQQAIGLDPNYARAYAGLADAVSQPSDVVPHHERAEKARAAAMKALSLAPDLAEAHTALAHILLRYDLDFSGAERELDLAIKLDPKWPDTYQRYSELYTALGRHDEALAKCREGLEIEPFNIPLNAGCAMALTYARRYDEGMEQLKKTIQMDPDHRNAHIGLVTVYSLKGIYAEAVEHRIIALKLADQHEWAENVREGFAKGGWPGVLRADLVWFEKRGYSADRRSHYNTAHLLAALGETDEAFAELEKSLENREHPSLVHLKTDPRFDPLRNDPRFGEISKMIGFPD